VATRVMELCAKAGQGIVSAEARARAEQTREVDLARIFKEDSSKKLNLECGPALLTKIAGLRKGEGGTDCGCAESFIKVC